MITLGNSHRFASRSEAGAPPGRGSNRPRRRPVATPLAPKVTLLGWLGILALSCVVGSAAPRTARAALGEPLDQSRLQGTGTVLGDRFGECVAVSGDHAMVVAAHVAGGTSGSTQTGTLFFYERGGANTWIETQVLEEGDLGVTGIFASRGLCDLDGTTAVFTTQIGDPRVQAVHVIERVAGAWSASPVTLAPPLDRVRDVALSGDTVVIGDDGGGYVYRRSGATWPLEDTLNATSTPQVQLSDTGESVDIDGDTILVGAQLSNIVPSGSDAGAVVVFERSGQTWSQETILVASDGAFAHRFGGAVAIDGDLVAVGRSQSGAALNAGVVYVFRRTGSVWNEEARLDPSDPQVGGNLGRAVEVSGQWVIGGALNHDGGPGLGNSGAVYVFGELGGIWQETARVTSEMPLPNDAYGASLSMDGSVLFVGAPQNATGTVGPGYAEVVTLDLAPPVPLTSTATRWILLAGSSLAAGLLSLRRSPGASPAH